MELYYNVQPTNPQQSNQVSNMRMIMMQMRKDILPPQRSLNVDVDILKALMCAVSLIRELERNRLVRMSIMGRDWLLTEHHVIPELASSCAIIYKLQGGGSPAEESVCVCLKG